RLPEALVLEEIAHALVRLARAGRAEPFDGIARALRKKQRKARVRQDQAWAKVEGMRADLAVADALGISVKKLQDLSVTERVNAQEKIACLFATVKARRAITENYGAKLEADDHLTALYQAYNRERKRRATTSQRLAFLHGAGTVLCSVHANLNDVFRDEERG